ncbi:hypothetical protein C8R47DRAFT_1080596 [Mycena vitilis]|nr:hypothetical protein C8R47DRAFT_1080596 [Mycena vitilis]
MSDTRTDADRGGAEREGSESTKRINDPDPDGLKKTIQLVGTRRAVASLWQLPRTHAYQHVLKWLTKGKFQPDSIPLPLADPLERWSDAPVSEAVGTCTSTPRKLTRHVDGDESEDERVPRQVNGSVRKDLRLRQFKIEVVTTGEARQGRKQECLPNRERLDHNDFGESPGLLYVVGIETGDGMRGNATLVAVFVQLCVILHLLSAVECETSGALSCCAWAHVQLEQETCALLPWLKIFGMLRGPSARLCSAKRQRADPIKTSYTIANGVKHAAVEEGEQRTRKGDIPLWGKGTAYEPSR